MKLRLVETPEDAQAFETAFDRYLVNDILPGGDLGAPLTEEDLAYFRSDAYRGAIADLCARDVDPAHRYFITLDGADIGFILCCTYHSEDGKGFILEMCVFPPYRGRGLGKAAFTLLQAAENAKYFELGTQSTRARRFWESLGFQPLGVNEEGSFMMVLRYDQAAAGG